MKILALALVLTLSGCGLFKQEVRVETIIVKVPVIVPVPAPKEIDRPELMIEQLTDADKKEPGKVEQFYRATVKQLQGYAEELEAIVEGYRILSEKKDYRNEN